MAATAEHSAHLQRSEAKPNVKPLPPTKVTLAFGADKPRVLVDKLRSSNVDIQRNALAVVCDQFKVPLNIVSAVKWDVVTVLNDLLTHEDNVVRLRAVEAMRLAAVHLSAKAEMVRTKSVMALAKTIDDPDVEIRRTSYLTLLNLCAHIDGLADVVDAQYVATLVERARTEAAPEITVLALQLLHKCTKLPGGAGMRDGLTANAIGVCTALLANANSDVREWAASTIAALSVPQGGKAAAIDEGTVDAICGLLGDREWRARAQAANALMNITVDDSGKRAAIEGGACEALVALLRDSHRLVQLNTVKTIATLSAHPQARHRFNNQTCISHLQSVAMGDGTDDLLKKGAQQAIDVVTWTP